MNPYLEIRKKYLEQPSDLLLSWEELVGFHLANESCYLIKGPSFFVMGRPVNRSAGPTLIRDLTYAFAAEECDAWFLYAFAGDMQQALAWVPYDLPFMAWDRSCDEQMRFIPLATVRRLCGYLGHSRS